MNPIQEQVRQFHTLFDCTINDAPTIPSDDDCAIRATLVAEEAAELLDAIASRDIKAIAKELADLLYVTFGTAETFGLDAGSLCTAVHASNMTKLWSGMELDTIPTDGSRKVVCLLDTDHKHLLENKERCFAVYRSTDGKVMKPPGYKEAEIELELQK